MTVARVDEMHKLLSTVASWFRPRPEVLVSVVVTDSGFTIERSDSPQPNTVRWDDIEEIRVFKLDLLTIDEIRVAFHVPAGWVELSERDRGFKRVVEETQRRFPSVPQGWYQEAMFPAFATNQRVLWRRS
jgi:hypothetical protein